MHRPGLSFQTNFEPGLPALSVRKAQKAVISGVGSRNSRHYITGARGD